ncbi:MAG TPA: DUF1707 domain-containing protein [Nocardioides sp.]|nr:DUF1707 domain-containing protein [Nocardioides sp.]
MTEHDHTWSAFSRDPRDPAAAELRASDADREVVHRLLAEAYADGRLDRDELEARTAETQGAKTLGMLVPPLEGLVARTPPDRARAGALPPAELERRAVEKWEADRREALWGLLSVSAIVWVIWAVTSGVDSFPWPVFVSTAALMNLGRVQFQRRAIVADHRERLERKQRQEIEKRQREPGE